MKKRLALSLLMLSIIGQGCGNVSLDFGAAEQSENEDSKEAASEDFEEKESEEESTTESVSSENSSDEEVSEKDSDDEESESSSSSDVSEDQELTDTSKYDEFLNNEEKAVFDETYYYIVGTDIACGFEEGKEYTLDEIVETAEEITRCDQGNDGDPEIETYYIDCGMDGSSELELTIHLPGGEDDRYDDTVEYYNILILTESEGKILVKFYTESNYFDQTSLTKYGYVETSGPAYNGIGSESAGYLDKDVNWHFYYACEYYLEARDYTNYQENTNNRIIDTSEGDWDSVYFERYSFDEDYKDSFTVYTMYNDYFPLIYAEDYPDDNPYKTAVEEAGIEIVSYAELESMLKERMEEIGLTDEISCHAYERDEIINARYRYSSIIDGEGTFIDLYSHEETTFEEFCESISENGAPEIKRATYIDLDGQNGKELILDLGTPAGVYLILSYIDGDFYGVMTTARCFEALQNNGTYMGSGGAGDSYYYKMTLTKDECTEETFAEYHDGEFTVDGEEASDYEGWVEENFSDPAFWISFS